jgi:membrane protein YqaA with SNARE-associated domain
MRLFGPLYDRVLGWAAHPKARWYLGGLSFAESSFFPGAAGRDARTHDLARPVDAWRLALLTTLTSVAGGVLGYLIGYFALDLVEPWLVSAGYWEGYLAGARVVPHLGLLGRAGRRLLAHPLQAVHHRRRRAGMFLPVFVLASLVGRGGRFFLVAGLIRWGGAPMEARLRRNVEFLGWLLVGLLVIAWFVVQA